MTRIMFWRDLRLDTEQPHTWAFYYYLKRQGDKVKIVKRTPMSIDIKVETND